MAKKLTKREEADAAWHRVNQIEIPVGADVQQRLVDYHETAPDTCPKCSKAMTPRSGWTTQFGDFLQCGGCGHTISVPREEFERVGRAIHDYHAKLAALPEKRDTGPRVRGAG